MKRLLRYFTPRQAQARTSMRARNYAVVACAFCTALLSLLLTTAPPASAALAPTPAAVRVQAAWARASVPGQRASGAFMTLTAKEPLTLVAVSSPMAGVSEIHNMKIEGEVMKMRRLPQGLDLPAGQAVQLKPGSVHLMLMDLKAPLQKDAHVPLTLVFKDARNVQSTLELQVPIGLAAPTVLE